MDTFQYVNLGCNYQRREKATMTIFEQQYHEKITDTPIYDCSVCQRNFFKKDIAYRKQVAKKRTRTNITTRSKQIEYNYFVSQCICKSCKKSYENGITPTFAVRDEIRRNKGTQTLSNLSELEERLVALRIPFLQIKEMGPCYKKPQLGLTGGVINVPTCINRIQSALPRNIRETDTVAVAIKIRLNLKNDYAIGRIRIHIVMKALKQLFQTMLYKLEDVKIDNKWEKVFIENKESYYSETNIEDDCTDMDDLPDP